MSLMTNTTTAQQIADKLNEYDGDNIWQDVILHLDEFDADATEAADPNGASNVVALTNGDQLHYYRADGWIVAEA